MLLQSGLTILERKMAEQSHMHERTASHRCVGGMGAIQEHGGVRTGHDFRPDSGNMELPLLLTMLGGEERRAMALPTGCKCNSYAHVSQVASMESVEECCGPRSLGCCPQTPCLAARSP